MVFCVVLAAVLGKWAFDSLSNWNVKRRAERAGMSVDVPPAARPFTDPESWSTKLLYASMVEALPKSAPDYDTFIKTFGRTLTNHDDLRGSDRIQNGSLPRDRSAALPSRGNIT